LVGCCLNAELCMCSGCVRKPIVQSSVPSFAVAKAASQNTKSVVDSTLIMNGVDCVTGASALSGVQPLSDVQMPSTSSHTSCGVQSGGQPSRPADEKQLSDASDELCLYTTCASPQLTDCLNDIWLSAAAVDLGSPLVPRSSRSCTAVGPAMSARLEF